MFKLLATVAVPSLLLCAAPVSAATFFGPTPYLSSADIPAGFYAGGSPLFLDDLEDGTLDGGITVSAGSVLSSGGLRDSVDADDGLIDGSGSTGNSFFSGNGPTGVIFTFASRVTAAAAVWTDGAGTTTFEAFRDGTSLGIIGPVAIAGQGVTGQTAEDRFFGITDLLGIDAIKLSSTSGGIEIDHIQYGNAFRPVDPPSPVPLPAGGMLLLGALAGLAALRRRLN